MRACVFGASSDRLDPAYFAAAEELGRELAAGGHTLIFGGGQGGLMGAVARGAAALGGEIVGVAPRFFDEPGVLFEGCTRFVFTDTMRERKGIMEDEAEGFVLLPGGIGSFEEFFEVLPLRQLGRHQKPISVLNTRGYYDSLLSLLQRAVEEGFLSERCLKLFRLCAEPREALEALVLPQEDAGGITRLEDYAR